MNEEKQIEEAACIEAGFKPNFDMEEERYYQSNKVNVYEAFIAGAKSQAAKEYHTKGMYSDKDMIDFAVWCGENYVCYHSSKEGSKIWFDSIKIKYYKTEHLLKEWANKDKKEQA